VCRGEGEKINITAKISNGANQKDRVWIFHISAGEFCSAAQQPLLSLQRASCDRLFSSYG
jgi:hypothetical protein